MKWAQIEADVAAVMRHVFEELRPSIEALADDIAERLRGGAKVMICGNGGSAADAQHMAGELVNRFLFDRRPYAGMALTTDTSVLTCIGNDFSFDQVFEKQVQALGRRGDVLVAISTSGGAANVCRAVEAARELGILTIGLTGGAGGRLAGLVERTLSISCTDSTPRIQEGHGLVIHLLCQRIEEQLG